VSDANAAFRGWHCRGYLPHLDASGLIQAVTFRLSDSLPRGVLRKWHEELADRSEDEAVREERRRIERFLDGGHGACWLADPLVAKIVAESIEFGDQNRYTLYAWVVMPNHVHLLFQPVGEWTMSSIVQSLKSYTAKQANRLLGRCGDFWYVDYFDRYIRSEDHFLRCVEYIHNNPVRAGLCRIASEWPWSSA
jgi:putative DNA methylase